MPTNINGNTGIDKVQDGTVVNADIDTLDASKLTGSIAAARIANNTIDSAHIASGAVDDAHLATGITASKLTGALPAISGANLTGISSIGGATGVDFNDNVKARFGTGNDLEIFHDGSHSYIKDEGTGNLILRTAGTAIELGGDGEALATFTKDGSVELYHDNVKKIETTATGVSLLSDSVIENTAGYLKVNAEDTLYLQCDSDNAGGESITFQHGTDTVMTINENGRTDWGAFTTAGNAYGFRIQGSTQQHTLYQSQNGNGNFDFHRYYNSSGYIGRIRWSSSSLSFENLSDYRRKENVIDMPSATNRLKQLKPKRFNLIGDTGGITLDGFLAHEVSPVCPEAVSGEKDGVDENGDPDYQFMDSSKLIPLLVKTIQELEARITAGGL